MASEGDSAMWLRVEDEDIDEAKLLRVTVNENTTGSGRKRRTSFVCTGTLHKDNEERMGEYDRAQKKIKADPRNDQDLQLALQREMMANFLKQKREREGDNLVDSEEDGDGEGGNLCFLHSPPFSFSLYCAHASLVHSTLRSPSLSLLSYCLSRTSQVGGASRRGP